MGKLSITKETGTVPTQILWDSKNFVAVSAIVANTGITAGADGKKIIYAGSPISGDLSARTTAMKRTVTDTDTPANDTTATCIGVLAHNIDVTAGNENAAIIVDGFIDLDKLGTTTAALITAGVRATLRRVTFLK